MRDWFFATPLPFLAYHAILSLVSGIISDRVIVIATICVCVKVECRSDFTIIVIRRYYGIMILCRSVENIESEEFSYTPYFLATPAPPPRTVLL